MGMFVNPNAAAFQCAVNSEVYIDKTGLLEYTNKVLGTNARFICNSRPRRFGKSVTVDMLTAYYSKGCDTEKMFSGLEISRCPDFYEHLNKYDVIHFDVQWCCISAGSSENLISYITNIVVSELRETYPEVNLEENSTIYGAMARINTALGKQFIVIIDEWDVLIRDEAHNQAAQEIYIDFLRNMFKGIEASKYIALAYLTGILPIKKLKTQSALNNFTQFTMLNAGPLTPYIGFNEDEVIDLCEKYEIDFAEVRRWYDGYRLGDYHVYNPNALVNLTIMRTYPVEFMAALMTSVIDFPNKVAEYILVCRQMGIKILPPDVNCGMYGFSVDNGAIRYGLSAIKSVGRPVIESLVREREENGQYRSLKDFMERNSPQMNKRAVENFIKAGALDCLDGNRRQKMLVYQKISDSISQEKKNSLAGQMSLFDLVSEEDKKEFEIRMPDVEEFGKEELLGYEKEVLGIYLSGHPLENYREMMEKTISAKTSDFQQDEETNLPKVMDGQKVIIGGMITDKTIKYTKNNKVMAFLTVEDLVGTVEVVVFPRDYEKSQQFLNEEGRVFIQGRVSAEDDRASKLILEKIRPFDNMPREIWIQFDNKESYTQQSQELLADLRRSPGDSAVVIYLKDVKAIKKLPVGYHAQIQDSWLNYMYEKYGKTNVKVVERGLKNL